jgi:hypothetical protein
MPDKSAAQELREWRENNIPAWRGVWKAIDEERRFLDGDRYQINSEWHNRDRRKIQIRGREVDDGIRHNVAQMTARPRNVEARPIDEDTDPDQAELEVSLVEQELANPLKGFDAQLEAAYVDVCAAGMGTLWMDWCPEEGPWGELVYSAEDPIRYMWSWDYADDPHHLLCSKLQRIHRMDVDYARERYKAPWLQPDRQAAKTGRLTDGVPLMQQAGRELSGLAPEDERVTLIEEWRKRDKKKRKDDRKLDPKDRYMACEDQECGMRMPPQGQMQESGELDGEYPEEDICPMCGSGMSRVDVYAEDDRPTYGNQRLIIAAPYSSNPEGDEPIYDGKWPVARLRSFPLFYLSRYVVRGRPRGDSDTSWNWDQQQAADQLRTIALQRTAAHRTYKMMPDHGIKNAKGKRFEFRDDDFDVMFYDGARNAPPPVVQFSNSSGLDPNWPLAFNPIYEALTRYRGHADLGSVEERKGKSGVALQTEAAVGEIPLAHLNRRKNYALSRFYGVVSDAIHNTYPPDRISRLNIEGADIVTRMWGRDRPNFDFVIEDTPDFTGLEQARSEAWDSGMQVMTQFQGHPNLAQIIEAWGRFHQIPRSVLRDLVKAFAVLPPMPMAPGQEPPMDETGEVPPEMMPEQQPAWMTGDLSG